MYRFLSVLLLSALLVGSCGAVSFIPSMDVMTYGADGELKTIWGEHNFYTDTSSIGLSLEVINGTMHIGGRYG